MRVNPIANSIYCMLTDRYYLILFYLFEFEQNVRNIASGGISWISNKEKKRREIFHFYF